MTDLTQISLIRCPKTIRFGFGAAGLAGEEAATRGAKKPLIVTDRNIVGAGLAKTVSDSLSAKGLPADLFDEVLPNPDLEMVERCAEHVRSGGYDLLIGVGGGSPLDVCKAAAVLARNGGRLSDYFGNEKVPGPSLPTILVPTTSGTGSEVTPSAVISDERTKSKNSIKSSHMLADVVLLDPELTMTMPPHVTADVGMDALTHAIEAYMSPRANPLSDTLAAEAIRLIARHLPAAYTNGRNREARYQMSIAATMAGMAFTHSSLGGVHALAYPLCTDYGLTHGRANAVLLPHVFSLNALADLDKAAEIAALMDAGAKSACRRELGQAGADALSQLLADVGIDGRLRSYGITKEVIPELVEKALRTGVRLLPGNPRVLTQADGVLAYETAW